MRYIHPNWIVVELADDGVASCNYPAYVFEPLSVDGLGLLTRLFTQLLGPAVTRVGGQAFKGCIENKMRASCLEYQFLPMSTGYRFRPIRKSSSNESPSKNTRTVKLLIVSAQSMVLYLIPFMDQIVSFMSSLMRLTAVFPPLQSLRSRHPCRKPIVVDLSHPQDSLATGIAPPPTLPLRLSARP